MKVKFVPQNIELEIQPNQTVMNLAHENKLPIHSVCNGLPSCAECRIKIVEGDTNVAPPSRKEMNLIGTGYYIDQRRLSCQLVCFGDITVDLTEQLEKGTGTIVPKKFLSRANKERPEDYNSVGGVLLEEDGALLKQAEIEAQAPPPRPPAAQQNQQRQPGPRQPNQNEPRRGQNQKGRRPRR